VSTDLRGENICPERVRTVLTDDSELAREKMWARIHLIPALQAEEDRDQVRRYLADKAREKELLGSETRVYNSDRYVMALMCLRDHAANMLDTDSSDQHSQSHRSTRQSRGSRHECQIGCGEVYIQARQWWNWGVPALVGSTEMEFNDIGSKAF
jgi:hypothetical protein